MLKNLVLCLTSDSVTAETYKEQVNKEKFPGIEMFPCKTINEFISKSTDSNIAGIVIDPVFVESLKPKEFERGSIINIAKSLETNKVHFTYNTTTQTTELEKSDSKITSDFVDKFVRSIRS